MAERGVGARGHGQDIEEFSVKENRGIRPQLKGGL